MSSKNAEVLCLCVHLIKAQTTLFLSSFLMKNFCSLMIARSLAAFVLLKLLILPACYCTAESENLVLIEEDDIGSEETEFITASAPNDALATFVDMKFDQFNANHDGNKSFK